MVFQAWWHAAGAVVGMAATVVLQGCTAVTAGQLVQAGYDAAKTSLTSSSGSADALRERAVMNAMSVGQDVTPVLEAMGVPPKEKSGNLQGYVCYQFAAVYSATEDAVIVARDGKVVFFGNSSCKSEMQAGNFNAGGKYAPGAAAAGSGTPTDSSIGSATGTAADSASSSTTSPATGASTGATDTPPKTDESPVAVPHSGSASSAALKSGDSAPDAHGQ